MKILDKIRKVVNSFKDNEIITRQDLINFCDDVQESTLDTYRRMLTIQGYLVEYQRGQYIKSKDIPKAMTIQQLRKFSYSQS